ncbi:Serine/Threonine-Protein Kinase Lmtk1 [Manis pentadactyla]|nr:Serine/Threonine-Protein Kinase Lmtk1 [Manis pentadactyla]
MISRVLAVQLISMIFSCTPSAFPLVICEGGREDEVSAISVLRKLFPGKSDLGVIRSFIFIDYVALDEGTEGKIADIRMWL